MNARSLFTLTAIFFSLITGTESFARERHTGGRFSFGNTIDGLSVTGKFYFGSHLLV